MSDLSLDLYRKAYLIRKSEEEICKYYPEDGMKTPMHMSMGEEAIAVGICHALKQEDQVFCSYRSHALYLAKTENIDNFFAEMYGKSTSLQKGKGGSMHLCEPALGFMGASAIVASQIPVAVGSAFANKILKNGKIVAVFFGDGAVDEGVFWESLNVACLMELPILFVCEDNDFAVHTPPSVRHGYASITEIVSNFNCNVFQDETTDVEVIYKLTQGAIKKMKKNQQPCFFHLKYYRYLEHVGINEDFEAGYRSRNEFEKWLKKDPIRLQRDRLIELGLEDEVQAIEKEIDSKVNDSIVATKKAPFADKDELYRGVLAEAC